jgi:hypothetical protein
VRLISVLLSWGYSKLEIVFLSGVITPIQ